MKLVSGIVAAAAILLIPATAHAQEAERPYVSGIYYQCGMPGQDRADAIMRDVIAPVYDKHLAAGHILAWGWLGHRSGGAWRRLGYFTAPSLDAVFDMQDAILAELRKDHQKEMTELNTICPTHDDYIWQGTAAAASASPAQQRTAVGHSSYMECTIGLESEADAIMASVIAPVMEKHKAAGHINGWNWLQHVSGGKYRRLMVVDGPTHKETAKAFGAIIQELGQTQPDAMRRFSEICYSHQDYMWNVLASKP